MPTALSWPELRTGVRDLRALLAFRSSSLTGAARRRLRLALPLLAVVTVLAAVVPAWVKDAMPDARVAGVVGLLPSMYLAFGLLAAVSAVASGGGREIVPRDELVCFPVSTTGEHLGALLLAPLNIAWLVQGWVLLGATCYVFGLAAVPVVSVPVLLWLVLATALGQVVGWVVEGVRRGPHGILVARVALTLLAAVPLVLVLTGDLTRVLDRSPTRWLLEVGSDGILGEWLSWTRDVALLLVACAVAVVLGGVPARWALLRPAREELRLESGHRSPRPDPASPFRALLRVDRAGVWRSVPLRRGLVVLALMPGVIALAGALDWSMLTVLPGLVASGGALLFGVNAWCLDGRGALWRDRLPAPPVLAFWVRATVLVEVLLVSALVTVILASGRAGVPSATELVALVTATLVVALQVVSGSLRWSVARPFTVDLRGARATPAPPVVMAGYSARLALATTLTGLLFSGLAQVGVAWLPLLVGLPMMALSGWRLWRTSRRWADPVVRARVVATVSG